MVKIIHAADLHLDSPCAALGPEQAALRRGELLSAVTSIAVIAAEENAELILFSGDLFDNGRVMPETVRRVISVLGGMKANVFIAPGNHDYFSPRSPYELYKWPDNVHIFRTQTITHVDIGENLTVYGAGFNSEIITEPILKDFKAEESDRIKIMVLHGETSTAQARYNPISERDIKTSGLDYLALGHIHSFSGILKAGGTYYAWPGCTEGRGFDETGEKGIIAGSIGRGEAELGFRPICKRRYEIIRAGGDNPVSIKDLLYGHRDNIIRLILEGERREDFNILSLEGLVYKLSVLDETRAPRDIWKRAEEESLTGLFLREIKNRLEGAQDEEKRRLFEKAAVYGLAALESDFSQLL